LSYDFVDETVENAENGGGEDEVDHHVNGIDVDLKLNFGSSELGHLPNQSSCFDCWLLWALLIATA
jgi:hypothetical protein